MTGYCQIPKKRFEQYKIIYYAQVIWNPQTSPLGHEWGIAGTFPSYSLYFGPLVSRDYPRSHSSCILSWANKRGVTPWSVVFIFAAHGKLQLIIALLRLRTTGFFATDNLKGFVEKVYKHIIFLIWYWNLNKTNVLASSANIFVNP